MSDEPAAYLWGYVVQASHLLLDISVDLFVTLVVTVWEGGGKRLCDVHSWWWEGKLASALQEGSMAG